MQLSYEEKLSQAKATAAVSSIKIIDFKLNN